MARLLFEGPEGEMPKLTIKKFSALPNLSRGLQWNIHIKNKLRNQFAVACVPLESVHLDYFLTPGPTWWLNGIDDQVFIEDSFMLFHDFNAVISQAPSLFRLVPKSFFRHLKLFRLKRKSADTWAFVYE